MEKEEITKKINNNLEKIVEDLIEILNIIKRTENDMSGLFFAKRRVLDIILTAEHIYDGLVKLRKIYQANKGKTKKKSKEDEKKLFVCLLNEMM
jgi:3-methyladenine DNA glycosylase/8-oxoguanine DNA glycosylase